MFGRLDQKQTILLIFLIKCVKPVVSDKACIPGVCYKIKTQDTVY